MSGRGEVVAGLIGVPVPLVEAYDLALLDLDGVVYVGPEAVPGAPEALDAVRKAGLRLSFVTNNASRPPETVAGHLTELGVPAEAGDVVTSAQAAAAILARRLPQGSKVLVVGGEGLYRALEAAGLVPVDSMDEKPLAVTQGFSPAVGWKLLAEGSRGVRAGLPWIATNTDLTVPTPYGPAPGNGTLVAAIAAATETRPEVAGKPQPTLFAEAAKRYGASRPIVVGDRLDTDLEGARAAGMDGLLVLTGVHGATRALAAEPPRRPHLISRDLTGLLEPHPAPEEQDGTWRCRDAVVAIDRDPQVDVRAAGEDPVDLLRAACAAVWEHADRSVANGHGVRPVDATRLLEHLTRLEGPAGWVR